MAGGKGKGKAKKLDPNVDRIILPDWTRISPPHVETDVDHTIELQVTRRDQREKWSNGIENYEMLDEASNSSAGGLIKQSVKEERTRLGVPASQDLKFERVVQGGGAAGQRWTPEQIRRGEHLDVLEAFIAGLTNVESPFDF